MAAEILTPERRVQTPASASDHASRGACPSSVISGAGKPDAVSAHGYDSGAVVAASNEESKLGAAR